MPKLAAIATALLFLPIAVTADAAFPGRAGGIVYEEGGVLFSVRPDGSGSRRLTPGGNPAFSPDGEQLAFLRGQVMVARRDGTRARRVFRGAYAVGWSPDGASLAVVDGSWKIVLIGASGRRYGGFSAGNEVRSVAWSPDGERLAFGVRNRVDAGALFVVRLDDDTSQRAIVLEPEGTNAYLPVWSPDGRHIAFSEIEGCRGETCGGPSFVAVVNADGSDKRRVARGFGPAWSPDGSRLAFSGDSGLTVLRLLDGSTTTVTPAAAERIDWQPLCTRRGGPGRDRIRGGSGADVVCGLAGNDVITGGLGSDRLFGEEGDDRFFARDRRFDVVGCGSGDDSVTADRRDLVGRDCERVRRR